MSTEPPSLQHPQDPDHDQTQDDPHAHTEPPTETSQTLATTLITKCRALLGEINAFQTLLAQTLRNPQVVEVRSLRSSVVSELRTLEKLGRKVEEARDDGAGPGPAEAEAGDGSGTTPGPETRLLHTLRSSNLPFYETVWAVAKGSCCGIAMFGKRFYWGEGEESEGSKWKKPNKDKRKSVLVDIVADDGEEWVKVSTISESRLLFEMAKKGWEGDE